MTVPLIKPPPLWGSSRGHLTIMCFLAVFLMMFLRFNMSMALVCMVGHGSRAGNATTYEFDWDKTTETSILSGFYYGYIWTQVLGGYLSDRFGGKRGLQVGVGVLAVGTLLTPASARFDYRLLIAVRVLEGLSSGLAFPSVYNLFSHWASPEERATLMSVAFAGLPVACVANFPISSLLCQTDCDGGWPMVFYVPGFMCLTWWLAFSLSSYNHPEDHPAISVEEKQFLVHVNELPGEASDSDGRVPWLAMLRCPAVYALCIAHITYSWGFLLTAVNLPLYVAEVLEFGVVENGCLSALPHVGMAIVSLTGKLFDWLRKKKILSLNAMRKTFNTIGMLAFSLSTFCLPLLGPNDRLGPILSLSLGVSLLQLATSGGFYFSHRDIGGRFAGTLFGITNTLAQGSREEWNLVFCLAGGISLFGCVTYLVFGSTDLQDFAKAKDVTDDEDAKDVTQTSTLEKPE